MIRTRIKFCGIQNEAQAALAVECAVDAIGVIFAPSPRRIELAQAAAIARSLPAFIQITGVFADHDEAALREMYDAVPQMIPQFCGAESPEYCERVTRGGPYLKVFHVPVTGVVPADHLAKYRGLAAFDTQAAGLRGGTGKSFAWANFARPARHFVLAGGLTPDNVAQAVRTLRPYAVDVRSGIERDGEKNPALMRAFVAAVRKADEGEIHATR